jgi:hypothetical protein
MSDGSVQREGAEMSQLARSDGQKAEGGGGRSICGLRSASVVCLAAPRITLLVVVAVALLGVGIFFGEASLATAATDQAAFTLSNGVQSYDDATPGGMALKELFKATSIVVQSGKATGLTNLPIALTYGSKPLTGTAALSLTGSYEDATGLLQGTYYYEYDVVYTSSWFGAERQVGAYNGTVEAALGANVKTADLFLKGSWTVTHYTPAPGGGWQEASPSWGSDARHVTFTLTGIVPEHGTVLGGFRGTGKTRVSHDGGTTWTEAVSGEAVTVDDMISVENVPGTRVKIVFPDGSFYLAKSGCIVKCLSGGLQVQVGEVWINLKKQGRAFEVVTPTSVAGVMGTEFQVIVAPGVKDEIALFSGQVEVTANAGGKVTLSPGQKVSCTQSGLGQVQTVGAFADISSSPYKAAILGMSQAGIVSGRQQAGTWVFAPLETVKRMQFAKMVCGAMSVAVSEDSWLDSAPPFPDLGADPLDDVYPHDFVAAASAAGIIKGDKGKFKPYDGIYRIGVILMVVRALDGLAPGSLDAVPAGFSSTVGGLSGEHAEAMRTAEYNDLTDGLAGFGTGWNAWATATRGEVAQILWNAMWR